MHDPVFLFVGTMCVYSGSPGVIHLAQLRLHTCWIETRYFFHDPVPGNLYFTPCFYEFNYFLIPHMSGIWLSWWLMVKFHLPVQETWVQSQGREDTLEKEMATHSNALAWEIPWTEEPAGYSSWGCKRVRLKLTTKTTTWVESCSHLSFCDWLISFSLMSSRFTCVKCDRIAFIFEGE